MKFWQSLVLVSLLFPFMTFAQSSGWRLSESDSSQWAYMRENNAAFWAQFQTSDSPLLDFQGVVLGDAHLGNFSIRNWNKGPGEFRFDDFDDVGVAPFAIDFLRFAMTSEARNVGVSFERLSKAYLDGLLARRDYDQPLVRELAPDSEAFDELVQDSWVTTKKRREIENVLKVKIKRARSYSKDTGGSQGLVRIRFELESGEVLELKPLATAATSYLGASPDNFNRLEMAKKVIWKKQEEYPKLVVIDSTEYQLREVLSKLNRSSDFYSKEMAIFIASRMGSIHRSQSSSKAYLDFITQDEERFISELRKLRSFASSEGKSSYQKVLAKSYPFEIGGSVRYRLQSQKEAGAETKIAHKFRLRLDTLARSENGWGAGARLETNQEATSGHENLGDKFEKKSLYISLAYIEKSFTFGVIRIGKTPNPFHTVGESELIWDDSITPEGASGEFKVSDFFINLGAYLLVNNYDSTNGVNLDDNKVLSAQVGWKKRFGAHEYLIGTGYTKFSNIERAQFNSIGKKSGQGNLTLGNKDYASSFELGELFLDYSYYFSVFKLGSFLHLVQNFKAVDEKNAFHLGGYLKFGDLKGIYSYSKVEADSVIGAFTNSSPGPGGSDLFYHRAAIEYDLTKAFEVGASHIWAKAPISNSQDYNKLRVDLTYKF